MNNMVTDVQDVDNMLEAIFSGDESSGLPIGSEDVYECKNPHWSISREGLKKILHIILSFPSKASIFVSVWREGNNIRFCADNRDAFIDAVLPLLNKDFYETDKCFCIDSTKLYAFLNSYSQFALSFDEDGTIYYESPYVRYKLDTANLTAWDSKIAFKPNSKIPTPDVDKWYKFPMSNRELTVFKNLYSFAVKLSDSRILINSDKADAFYTLYQFSVLNKTALKENVVLRRLDLPSLKEVIGDDTEFAFTKERLFFRFDLGFVSFLRVPYDKEAFMHPETFLTGELLGGFELDVPLVKRALKLASLFNVNELCFVPVPDSRDIYMTVSDKAKFKVGLDHNLGDGKPVSTAFPVGVEIFSNLLSTVSSQSLQVLVSEHGLELRSGSGVYSMSRASMNQIKSGNIPPALSTPSLAQPAKVDFQDSEVV